MQKFPIGHCLAKNTMEQRIQCRHTSWGREQTEFLLSPCTPDSSGSCPAFFSLHPKMGWRHFQISQQVLSPNACYLDSPAHHSISPLGWFGVLWLQAPPSASPHWEFPSYPSASCPFCWFCKTIHVVKGYQELAGKAWALESEPDTISVNLTLLISKMG